MTKVDKDLDPLIVKIKDSKAKKWEPKKCVPSSINEKKDEPVPIKSVISKDNKVLG